MTGLALWSLAKRFWPIAAAALVVLAVILWGNSRFDAGVAKERAEWTAEAARLRAIAATEAAQRAAAVNAAHDADTQRNAALERLLAPINDKVKSYADTANGRAVCPSPDGRLLAQQAVAAANASIAASPGARR